MGKGMQRETYVSIVMVGDGHDSNLQRLKWVANSIQTHDMHKYIYVYIYTRKYTYVYIYMSYIQFSLDHH